jgi:hypothetical protein
MKQIREPLKALASLFVIVLFGVFVVENAGHAAVPAAAYINVSTSGTSLTISWSSVPDADGYIFYYAPYPDVSYIGDLDVGNVTGPFELNLPPGAAFYVAVQAYNSDGESNLSNIEYFVIAEDSDDTNGKYSFSPISVRDANGDPIPLYWKYRINGGQPLVVDVEGDQLGINIGDLQLNIDPSTLIRKASLNGSFSGDFENVSGSFSVEVIEYMKSLSGKTLIERDNFSMDMSMSAYGIPENISMNLIGNYNPPIEWFLDKENLDDLPIGYVYDEQGMVNATVSGSIIITGFYSDTVPIDNYKLTSPEVWEIIDKQNSITVMGNTYQNVVVVRRTTLLPSNNTGELEEVDIIYWVAKGVGMVKGINQYQLFGEPLTIELIESNLVQ